MQGLDDIFAWVGLVDAPAAAEVRRLARTSYLAMLGGPTLVRQVVAIPLDTYKAAATWRVTVTEADGTTVAAAPVAPTAVELGHAGLVRRVARLLLRLPAEEGPAGTAGGAAATATVAVQPPTPSPRKVVTSKILDQGDDTEVKPLDAVELRRLTTEWIARENDGEEPVEEEEATGDQIAALDARMKNGDAPFADFGIFRPYGARLGRAMKFVVHHVGVDGAVQSKEINGPGSFEEWSKCWAVFVFAMTLLQQATRTRLMRYHARIQKLVESYPGMWWVIGQADIVMRSEHLQRIMRRCLAAHAAGTLPEFVPTKPWGIVFREAAADDKFWDEKVDKKVIRYATHMANAQDLVDSGYGGIEELDAWHTAARSGASASAAAKAKGGKKKRSSSSSEAGPKKAKKKKKGTKGTPKTPPGTKTGQPPKKTPKGDKGSPEQKHADGRWFRDATGAPLCWAFNHKEGGCAEPCTNSRIHKCEWCREAHRSINCPRKPASWRP